MIKGSNTSNATLKRLKWPLGLTLAGLIAERFINAFWPLLSVVLISLAPLMFGFHQNVSLLTGWALLVLAGIAALSTLVYGLRNFRWPSQDDARLRLDETLPNRPIAAVLDDQIIGVGDPASKAIWQAHVKQMAERAAEAKAVSPDLRVSKRDPYALRYVAMLAFLMALIFGSIFRVATVGDLISGASGADLRAGPSWEGWVEPPAYTGKPTIYLADVGADDLTVPEGSRLTLRLYGEIGALVVTETVSGIVADEVDAEQPSQSYEIAQSGSLTIQGQGGQSWQITATPDEQPTIALNGEVERRVNGDMQLPYVATDDYGVQSAYAELVLDLDAVDRRYGLVLEPEPQELIALDLPMPFRGDRLEISETLVENLAQHPWVGLPVKVTLFANDAAQQTGASEPETITLPGRRFFDPLAAALIEQRRDILWNRENATRVAQILRAVSHRPDDLFDSDTAYLKLRVAIRRLETGFSEASLSDEMQEETAQVLWDIAVLIEDGNLADALERLHRAEERLEQAMRDGATDDEIAELMQELSEAMQDYMQQLAQNQDQNNTDQAQNQNTQEITGEQLQAMLDRLQELMEQGRMAEAQELMDQLRQMMENMQVAEGQGQQGPGQQALDGLADTLEQQQGLNDETFSDLQDQFGQEGQQGEQGEQGQGGQQGQQGQSGQGGEQGQGDQQGEGQGRGAGNDPAQGLAGRQQALRNELNRQAQNLPGAGSPGGEAARDALDRAGRAMEGAEQALRQDDYAGALDNQAEALEALREGMRELADELAQQQNQQTGQQGQANGRANNETRRDPLGRDAGAAGQVGTDEQLLQGEDVYRRAQELLEEIRRRSSDQDRPDLELEYLKRLLDRF